MKVNAQVYSEDTWGVLPTADLYDQGLMNTHLQLMLRRLHVVRKRSTAILIVLLRLLKPKIIVNYELKIMNDECLRISGLKGLFLVFVQKSAHLCTSSAPTLSS